MLFRSQDNADARLTPIGYEIGLIGEERFTRCQEKQKQIEQEIQRLQKTTVPPGEGLNALLVSRETAPITSGIRLYELLRRPQISYFDLAPFDLSRPDLPPEVQEQVEITISYEGYIQKQLVQVAQMRKLEGKALPEALDYREIRGLRLEAIEKLNRLHPTNIGQASRISGVSPADISVLLIWINLNED